MIPLRLSWGVGLPHASRLIMRFTLLIAAFAAVAAASASRTPIILAQQPRSDLDSIVVERTLCFGTCPAYRLSLRRGGDVHFRSRNPGESIDTTDHVAPTVLDSLYARAARSQFFSLPDSVDEGSSLCPIYATDHPTLTLTFHGRSTKRVFYYTGCYLRNDFHTVAPSLQALARLAVAVDSATGARRWIHPSRGPR